MFDSTRGAVLAVLVAAPLLGRGQQQPAAWPATGQLVREGVALHDQQDYPGAIAKYEAVTPGDTTYALAQGELAVTLNATNHHAEAVAAAQRSLALHPFESFAYNALADSQEELKQPEAALATYQQALRLFPYNAVLYYNQGVTLMRQHQLAAALASLQHAAELRPLHPSAHRLLALLAARQGQQAHALISLLTYLVLNDDAELGNDALVLAEKLSQGAPIVDDDERRPPVSPNAAFAELDQLITSKVALQKGYTSKVKFTAAVVKQTQLLVEKFPVDGPADDFWIRAYGPMVRALRQDDNLTTFTYLVLRTASDPKAAKWVKSNQKKVKKLAEATLPALLRLREQQLVAGDSTGQRRTAWFDTSGSINGLGTGSYVNGELQGTGDWVTITNEGAVLSRGRFTAAGKQVGLWETLRPDGSVESAVTYNEKGEHDGPAREYHPNGQLAKEITYRAGEADGQYVAYNECGTRLDTRTFKAGVLEGPYAVYYDSGQLRYRATVHADKVDGQEERFYPDGTLRDEQTYVAGQQQGPLVTYYRTKQVEKRMSFDQNTVHGPYLSYHPNGQVSESGTMAHGKHAGTWKTYYATGTLASELNYDEAGELHGPHHEYAEDGHRYSTTDYEHGRTARLRFFDPQGQPRLDQPLKKGRTTVKTLTAAGDLNATGAFSDGQATGEWRWYYRSGEPSALSNYDAQGNRVGLSEKYYANGQLKSRTYYNAEGQEDGYHEDYGQAGQLTQAGHYRHGQRQGPWKYYYVNGQLSSETEFHRDEQNGVSRAYTPGGKLAQERRFEFGKLRQVTTYDSTGQVLTRVELTPATKTYTLRYPGGQPLYTAGVACYTNHGTGTWLYPDGRPEVSFEMRDDQRYGPHKVLYSNGKTHQEGAYLNGIPEGEWRTYYRTGQLENKGSYLDGEQAGEWLAYFPNGQVETVKNFRDGSLHGVVRRYNPAGELLVEEQYTHGDLVAYRGPTAAAGQLTPLPGTGGQLRTTFANGKPAVVATYDRSLPTGTTTLHYASGQLFRRLAYDKGLLHGEVASFYPGGQPLATEHYLHGELHGRCRYYRPDGTLEREATYQAGELAGPTTYYDAAGKPQRTEQYWNTMVYTK